MDFDFVHIDETDSTNRWLRAHGEGDMVVTADFQTAGRGCGTNSWESERGRNLLFSILIHPVWLPVSQQFFLSMAVSNAIRRTLENLLQANVTVKWPNDIYVDDGKICGILIENGLQNGLFKDCIIGIGLNVNQTVFASDAPNPVSMRQIGGRTFDRHKVLSDVMAAFVRQLQPWDAPAVAAEYRRHLYRRQGLHRYDDGNGPFMAALTTVEDDGHLLLTDTGGHQRRYAFKEVAFLPDDTSDENNNTKINNLQNNGKI